MPRIAVVTDSLADIPENLQRELGIATVPTLVRFGETVFRDRVDLSTGEFYERLRNRSATPFTSQPPPSAFEETFRRVARESDEILAITTTAKLSGIYGSAVLAAENVADIRVEVVDSEQVTMALGWIVIIAARAARQGASMEELVALVKSAIPRSHILAMLDTLEFAQRSGRLGRAQALISTLLNVKPIISLINGVVEPVEKVRTLRRGLGRLQEMVLASGPIQELAVMHAAGQQHAEQLRTMFAASLDREDILVAETGPVLGTHVGPGAVGAAWVNRS